MKKRVSYLNYITAGLILICTLSQSLYATTNDYTKIMSRPLFYPNPFRFSVGSTLGYELNKSAAITLKVFDIFGNEHLHYVYPQGYPGGEKGYNKISITAHDFSTPLSSGVYYFVLLNAGHLLQKGKFIIKP